MPKASEPTRTCRGPAPALTSVRTPSRPDPPLKLYTKGGAATASRQPAPTARYLHSLAIGATNYPSQLPGLLRPEGVPRGASAYSIPCAIARGLVTSTKKKCYLTPFDDVERRRPMFYDASSNLGRRAMAVDFIVEPKASGNELGDVPIAVVARIDVQVAVVHASAAVTVMSCTAANLQ